MLYIQAIKCLQKVKQQLHKEGRFKDEKLMTDLIYAIEKHVNKLQKKNTKNTENT